MKKFIFLPFIFLLCSLSIEKDIPIYDGWRIEHNILLAEFLFSNTKITWTKEFQDSVVNYKAVGNFVAVSFGTRKQSNLYFKDFERDKEWVLSGKDQPHYSYKIFGEDEPRILVLDYLNEGSFKIYILDREGQDLFNLKTNQVIKPSPKGVFYHSGSDVVSGTPLLAYNKEGKLIWTVSARWGCTDAETLDDSVVIYLDGNELYLYDLNSGKQVWADTSLGRECWQLVTSRNGENFIVFGSHSLFSFTRDGERKWSKYDQSLLYHVKISADGHYVALHTRKDKDNSKSTITLLDNKKKGKALWVQEINEKGESYLPEILEFHGDHIQLIPEAIKFFYYSGISDTMKTYIYKINKRNGKLISNHVLPGNVQLIEEKGKVTGYYQLQVISGKKVISRVEAVP